MSKQLFDSQCLNLEQKTICGSFETNGTGTFDTLAIGTSTSEVLYTAVDAGASGLSVAHVTPAVANSPLQVGLLGSVITVSLATNGSQVAVSTAAQVATAVNAITAIAALVVASTPNGSGAGTAVAAAATALSGHAGGVPLSVNGIGFTVNYTGTGTYVITLDDNYALLLSAYADLQLAATATQMAQITQANVTNTGTLPQTVTITTISTTSGSAVDVAANAGNRVNFSLEVQNTKAPPT